MTALTLARGPLRFTAEAAGDGPLVLLLHGFPDGPETFAAQLPALAASGYRAVAVTLRGYEPPSQPADGDYGIAALAGDVAAMADALGADRFHLVGHDWGASIAFAAAARMSERLASLTAIAVPHPARFAEALASDPAQLARSHYMIEFQAPGFEERIVADDCAYLEALWRAWSPGWAIPAAALAEMKAVFARPGVAAAALAYYRQAFNPSPEAAAAAAGLYASPIVVPTLAIAGLDDGCIAADLFAAAMRPEDFPAGLAVERVASAGHFVHREAADAVNRLLLDWLARHPA